MGTDELTDMLSAPSQAAAQRLLGCLLVFEADGKKISGRIVETEAYDQEDAASHSYKGRTQRTDVMFGPPGRMYVYFTYGMHYCCNVVTGSEGHGSAVLIRAVEPIDGIELMAQSRGGRKGIELTNGPAKICQAFGIDKTWNGHDLRQQPLRLVIQEPLPRIRMVQTTRVGISQAKDVPWRFYIKDNLYVSKA